MAKKALVLLLFILCLSALAYALDWKKLHEEADSSELARALASAKKNFNSLDDLYVLGLVYLNNHMDKDAQMIFENMLVLMFLKLISFKF